MRVLLIEDDSTLSGVMQRSLQDAGHRVDLAVDLHSAQQLWQLQAYDAVLLDLNLPIHAQAGSYSASERASNPALSLGSGLSLLRQARARGDTTPVLVLTARSRTDERIAGLDAGADDYLAKPFDLGEVEARLRALMRRHMASSDTVQLGALMLDRKARRFTLGQQNFDLPAREFEVLCELMSPPGRVVSKTALANKLSSFDELLADNALEAFISRLRKKLGGCGVTIRTLRGLGYRIELDADA